MTDKQSRQRWWAPVLELVFDDAAQEPLRYFDPNMVKTSLPCALEKLWLTGYTRKPDNDCGVFLGGERGRRLLWPYLRRELTDILTELPLGSGIDPQRPDGLKTARQQTDFANDNEMRQWIATTLNQYVSVLRPRLIRYFGDLATD